MKICKIIIYVVTLCISFITNVCATNLMDVYEKAFANDPQFKKARAEWLANKEQLAINRADLLPVLGAKGNLARNRNEMESGSGSFKYRNNTAIYSIQLTQPIFNFESLAGVWHAQAIAEGAKAKFMSEEENLLLRTTEAYFNVLQAQDILSFAKANKAAVERLFIQNKHKYDVGLIPVVDLEESRRDYYKAISEEIGAINELNSAFEKLNEITGIKYSALDSLKKDFPLPSPKPADIEKWAKAAEKQNLSLIAARYESIAARENVKAQNAGHLPSISGQASYSYQYDNNYQGSSNFSRNKTATAGLEVLAPIFHGGKVLASAKKADYEYQGKLSHEEQLHRNVISETRQAYLGILSNISKIEADLQAIKAAQSSLRANQAEQSVGIKTMADVLSAQSTLYEVQKTFTKDEYSYINLLLKLKAFTGILDTDDLKQINSWLEEASVVVEKSIVNKTKSKVIEHKNNSIVKNKKAKIVTTAKKNLSNSKK